MAMGNLRFIHSRVCANLKKKSAMINRVQRFRITSAFLSPTVSFCNYPEPGNTKY